MAAAEALLDVGAVLGTEVPAPVGVKSGMPCAGVGDGADPLTTGLAVVEVVIGDPVPVESATAGPVGTGSIRLVGSALGGTDDCTRVRGSAARAIGSG